MCLLAFSSISPSIKWTIPGQLHMFPFLENSCFKCHRCIYKSQYLHHFYWRKYITYTGVDISHLPGAQLHPLKVGPAQAENQTDGTIVMLPVDQVHHVLRYLPKGAKVGTFLNPESVR